MAVHYSSLVSDSMSRFAWGEVYDANVIGGGAGIHLVLADVTGRLPEQRAMSIPVRCCVDPRRRRAGRSARESRGHPSGGAAGALPLWRSRSSRLVRSAVEPSIELSRSS